MTIFKKLNLLIIGVMLVGLIYAGLGYYNIASKIQTNNDDLTNIKNKISNLEKENAALTKPAAVISSTSSEPIQNASNDTKTTIEYIKTTPDNPSATYSPAPVAVEQATLTVENIGSFKVNIKENDTAFSILLRAGAENNLTVDYDSYSFGVFVKSIGGILPAKNQFWAFFYNGTFSNIGASDQKVKNNDQIFWQLSSF